MGLWTLASRPVFRNDLGESPTIFLDCFEVELTQDLVRDLSAFAETLGRLCVHSGSAQGRSRSHVGTADVLTCFGPMLGPGPTAAYATPYCSYCSQPPTVRRGPEVASHTPTVPLTPTLRHTPVHTRAVDPWGKRIDAVDLQPTSITAGTASCLEGFFAKLRDGLQELEIKMGGSSVPHSLLSPLCASLGNLTKLVLTSKTQNTNLEHLMQLTSLRHLNITHMLYNAWPLRVAVCSLDLSKL